MYTVATLCIVPVTSLWISGLSAVTVTGSISSGEGSILTSAVVRREGSTTTSVILTSR